MIIVKKSFRSAAFVIRKRQLAAVPILIMIVILTKISFSVPCSRLIFKTALLCMDNSESVFGGYKSVFASSNIVFASAAKELKAAAEPVAAVPEPEPQPEESAAAPASKAISIPSSGTQIKNHTSFAVDTDALFGRDIDFLPVEIDSAEPQVLIFHTHTTESFEGSDRTDDEEKNVVAVGNVIEKCLSDRGVNVLHCKTVHDYDYNGSYLRSYETVETLLAENPSVKVVLDVHRDGITYEDGSGLRVTADINGETQAQFMLVLGTDEGGLYHPNWEQNLSFGLKIQQSMNEKYPGLARPLDLRTERFNQCLSPGMLIVECGGNGNTLDEVKRGAVSFSDALFDVITAQNR